MYLFQRILTNINSTSINKHNGIKFFNNSVKNRYEDTKKIPVTNYGKMKSQAEDLIYKFCQKKKLSSYFSILRITKVLDKKFDPVLNWKKKIKNEKVIK